MFLECLCSFMGGKSRRLFGPFEKPELRERFRIFFENSVIPESGNALIVTRFVQVPLEGVQVIHPMAVPEFVALC